MYWLNCARIVLALPFVWLAWLLNEVSWAAHLLSVDIGGQPLEDLIEEWSDYD